MRSVATFLIYVWNNPTVLAYIAGLLFMVYALMAATTIWCLQRALHTADPAAREEMLQQVRPYVQYVLPGFFGFAWLVFLVAFLADQ